MGRPTYISIPAKDPVLKHMSKAELEALGTPAAQEELERRRANRAGKKAARTRRPSRKVAPNVDARVTSMHAMYKDGATLREVGTAHSLSGERVRQLLLAAGLATRSREDVGAKRRAEASASGKEQNPERPGRTGRRAAWAKKKYSNEELIECLREASAILGGVLSAAAYTRLAKTRAFPDGRPWPTHQTHFHRFGSWRNALEAAGLRANPSSAIAGRRLFEVGHCIDAIRHAHRELGRIPTVADYDRMAAGSNGALPSSATIRNRCGSWVEALRLAGL